MLRIRRSIKGEICSVALSCVALGLVLLFPLFGGRSITTETVAANDEWVQVTPGSTTRRELKSGGKDVLGIDVDAGKLIRFSIEKGDLGLSTVVYGPTGAKILEHISREFETIEISFPADTAGFYRIELRSLENAETPKPYELTFVPLRRSTPRDQKDSEVRQLMAHATALCANWTASSLQQASENYDAAAAFWNSVQDFPHAARATLKSGDIHFLLSNYPQASERYQKAASLAAKSRDRVTQAIALSQLGRVSSNRGDNNSAEQYIEKALDLLQGDNEAAPIVRHATGLALSASGEVTYAKGNLPKAADQFDHALELLDRDRNAQANVHMFLAYISGASRPEKAKSEILLAQSLYQATNNKDGEGLALVGLGLYYSSNRQESPAVGYHRQAIEIFQAAGDRQSQAITSIAVGQVYENLFKFDVALGNYEHALKLLEEIDAADMATMALLKIGTMYRRMNKFSEAVAYLERGRAATVSAGKSRTEAAITNEIAGVYADQHKSAAAAGKYKRVLRIYEGLNDLRGTAIALNDYGDFLMTNGQTKEALNTYRRAVRLGEQVRDKGILTTTIYNLANANRSRGDYQTALSYIEKSVQMLEDIRNDAGSPESRASFVSGVWRHYELCVEILMQLDRLYPDQGFGVRAFLLNDRSRARLVLDLLNQAQADEHDSATVELLNKRRELAAYLTSLSSYEMSLSLNKKSSMERAEVNKRLTELNSEYQEVQAQLQQRMPARPSLDRFTLASLDQVQNELRNSDTLLLQFELGTERSYLWAVTENSFRSYELPSRKTITDTANEVSRFAMARQKQNSEDGTPQPEVADRLFDQKAIELSEMLFAPVARELGNKKLLIVAEGALQSLPFDALPVPGTPGTRLVQTNEISLAASVATVVAIRAEKRRAAPPDKIAAVIADPVFSKSDDRLQAGAPSAAFASAAPTRSADDVVEQGADQLRGDNAPARLTHASEEADAIAAAAPRGTTMIAKGFDATYETATSPSIGQYQIVHFATHGFLDNEHPELSGIVLTMVDRKGGDKNGLMPLHDIYNLNLHAELTVLSACQTALGKDVSGEGFVGLTHSFISAGSKSVVASLWKVDDRATAALMAEFYNALLQDGMTTGGALRTAKLKLMQDKRWSAPYYWAGFVLHGEYTNRIAVERNSWFRPGVLVLSLVLISSGVIFVERRRRRSVPARRV